MDYLSYTFHDTPELVSTFDELPLWSAPFGLLLLKHLELKPNIIVVDAGSGAGFPLTELAERLGKTSTVYGIDPWTNANVRAKQKIKSYGISNVEIIEGSAEKIPFPDNHVDLVVSNLGINNFEKPAIVFKECHRVLKPGGRLALTTNLNGHWKLFYDIFEKALEQQNRKEIIKSLRQQQEHRGTVESIAGLFTSNGFQVRRTVLDQFEMNFLDGSAFLNHHFIKLGWLTSWLDLVPMENRKEVFTTLEKDMNAHAKKEGQLKLQVPMAFIEGEKN